MIEIDAIGDPADIGERRPSEQTLDPGRRLEGEIGQFMEAYLKWVKGQDIKG